MSNADSITRAIEYVRSKGVRCLKIELETWVNPTGFPGADGQQCTCNAGKIESPCGCCEGSGKNEDGEPCERCEGNRIDPTEDIVECPKCQGTGHLPSNDPCSETSYLQRFNDVFRANAADLDLDVSANLEYYQTMLDTSVGTELTFTLDIAHLDYAPKVIDAFSETCAALGNDPLLMPDATKFAGLHMTFLWSSDYPSNQGPESEQLQTFKSSIDGIQGALLYLGSNEQVTRDLRYRGFSNNVRSRHWIEYHHDDCCIEFRIFDPCYENPSKVLENFLYMAQTLDFYQANRSPSTNVSPSSLSRWGPRLEHSINDDGRIPLRAYFRTHESRQSLIEEIRFFANGPFSTQRAREAEDVIGEW